MKFINSILFIWIFIISYSTVFAKNQAITGDTVLSRQYLLSGIAKLNSGDYKGSIPDFENAIKENPNNWEAYSYKGDAENGLHIYPQAIEDYSKALSINKNDVFSYKGRAEAKRLSRQFAEAITDYNIAIKLDPNNDAIFLGRALAYYVDGNYKEAIVDYSKCIAIKPNETRYYYARGQVYLDYSYYNPKYCREALNDFNKSISLLEKDDIRNRRALYLYRGRVYLGLNELDSALIDLSSNLMSYPTNAEAYKWLGKTYEGKRDSTNANKSFAESVRLNPNDADTYSFWGYSELDFKHYKKARQILTSGILKNAEKPSSKLFYYLALADIGAKEIVSTLNNLDKAIKADSKLWEAYYVRSLVYATDYKDYKKGCEDIKTAKNLGGIISEEIENYVCKGKTPPNGKIPEIPISPEPSRFPDRHVRE